MSHTALTEFTFLSFGLFLRKTNSIVSVPTCFFQPWDRQPDLLHIKLVQTG